MARKTIAGQDSHDGSRMRTNATPASSPQDDTVPIDTMPARDTEAVRDICISIVIPVYNDEDTIAHTLESCLSQSLSDIEIICVNDGSTDGTAAILSDFAKQDDRIRVITHDRTRTAFQARRTGVLHAQGTYIMFVDGDDELAPQACEMVYRVSLIDQPDIIHFGSTITNPSGKRMKFEAGLQPTKTALQGSAIFDEFFGPQRSDFQGQVWSRAYHRVLAQSAFGRQPEDREIPRANDTCMTVILLALARSYRSITDRLYHYCFGRGVSTGREIDLATYEVVLKSKLSYEVIAEFLNENPIAGHDTQALLFRFRRHFIVNSINYLFRLADPNGNALNRLFDLWPSEEVIEGLQKKLGTSPEDLLPTLRDFRREATGSLSKIKTIGLYIDALGFGGVQRVVALQARLFAEAGYSVVIVTGNRTDTFPYPVPESVRIRVIPADPEPAFRNRTGHLLRGIKEIVREERIDVLVNHSNYREDILFFSLGLSVLPVKTIFTVHNFCLRFLMEFDKRLAIFGPALALYDVVTVLSPTDQLFWRNAGVGNVLVVPNPIEEVIRSADLEEKTRGKEDTIFQPVDVVWVGRLQENTKCVSEVVRVLAEVQKTRPGTSLRIVGPEHDKGIRSRLAKLAMDLGVGELVEICPETDQPLSALESASVVVQTSSVEGFAYSLVEAVAVRRPVVMYSLPYLTVPQGNPAIFEVPWGRRDLCAKQIVALLDDDQLRMDVGNQGHDDLKERFSDDALIAMYRELFTFLESDSQPPQTQLESATPGTASVLVSEALRLYSVAQKRETEKQASLRKDNEALRSKLQGLESEQGKIREALAPVMSSQKSDPRSRVTRLIAHASPPRGSQTIDTITLNQQESGIWPLWQQQNIDWKAIVSSPFSDIAPEDDVYPAACWMLDEGLLPLDREEGKFDYLAPVTRGDLLSNLWVLAGRPTANDNADLPFEDLSDNELRKPSFIWACKHRIIGTGSNEPGQHLRPDAPLRRAAMAAFLYRAAGRLSCEAPKESPFIDVAAGQTLYKGVWWCAVQGIVTGHRIEDSIEFDPTGLVNRGGLAETLFRFSVGPVAARSQKLQISPADQALR